MTHISPTAVIPAPAAASAPAPNRAATRPPLPSSAMTIFSIAAAITFSASSSAPTPLYRLYQQGFGLSAPLTTAIFAVYAFSLLAALLTVGSVSDHIGRRPVIFAALILNAAAMVLFAKADSAAMLIAARAVQGFATGAATTTLGAAILDTDRARGPLYNSITAFLGLTLGSLGSGVLVTFGPHPTQLIYVVLLMVTGFEIVLLTQMPETTAGKSGALAALRPHVSVPAHIRRPLIAVMPVTVAAWALGGFHLSLMPSLVRAVTGLNSPVVGAVTVSTLMLSAAAAVVLVRHWNTGRTFTLGTLALILGVAITLAGVREQSLVLLLAGTVSAGFGFGASFAATLRTILPLAAPAERAGVLATFYVASYLAFAVPAIGIAFVVPVLGLAASAFIYGAVLMVLATLSLVIMQMRAMRAGTVGGGAATVS